MTMSELLGALELAKNKYGDLPVFISIKDEGYCGKFSEGCGSFSLEVKKIFFPDKSNKTLMILRGE